MLCLSLDRLCAVNFATRVDEPTSAFCGRRILICALSICLGLGLEWIKQVSALITLVAAGTSVTTDAAFTFDEAISQERVVLFDGAERLSRLSFLDEAVCPEP